jgi:hypothetical protein
VVAPFGFQAPNLAAALARKLVPLTTRQRHRRVVLYFVLGEPVGRACSEAAKELGWDLTLGVPAPDAPRAIAVAREGVALVAVCQAALLVGPPGDSYVGRLEGVCRWLAMPYRLLILPAGKPND